MKNSIVETSPQELSENIFSLFEKDWALLSAGSKDACNTMTVSWGAAGILWGKPIAFCFVRPQRYTYEFMEQNEGFTLSFFPQAYRDALSYCGSHSGRDGDKIKATGLTALDTPSGVAFEEAKIVLCCKKIYFDDFKPEHFLAPEIMKNYPQSDYHRFYIGEIVSCLEKKQEEESHTADAAWLSSCRNASSWKK